MVAQVNNGVRDYKKFVAQVNKNKKKNNGVWDFKM